MARNPSISLTEHQQAFVRALVESGRYHGVSEVVRAGLRLLEDEEARRAAELRRLQADVQDGLADIEAGRVRDFDAALIIKKGEAKRSQRSSSA
ncbi:MAG: type II toxin-antitoxin system ParD family antitoxin [Pseudomonadota bacterium]